MSCCCVTVAIVLAFITSLITMLLYQLHCELFEAYFMESYYP